MILKPCPFCRKDIPRSITVCPYCHRDEQGKPVVIDTVQVDLAVSDSEFRAALKELASEDAFIRDQAVHRMAQLGAAVVPALITHLQEFSQPGLAGIARVLGRIADPRAIGVLSQAAKIGDEDLRMAAVWALAQIHTPEALPALLTEAEKPHPLIQSYVASVLPTFQDIRVGPVLARLARHQNREIAFQASFALGEVGGPSSISALQASWHSGGPLVRGASASALQRLGIKPSRVSKRLWMIAIWMVVIGGAVGWYFYK